MRFLVYSLLFLFPGLTISDFNPSYSFIPIDEVIENSPDVYSSLELASYGLSMEAFNTAFVGFNKLKSENRLENPNILTIVDFSQSSKNKRLYTIDFEKGELIHHTLVAHGRNTGEEFARKFSNIDGSWQSSLGFYITKGTNMGASVGFSLIMEGVEKGINDNAQRRQIIVHGAEYATENFIRNTGRLGRSFGCPAVPPADIRPIVNTIKDGTALFIYYPDADYLSNSTLLNG